MRLPGWQELEHRRCENQSGSTVRCDFTSQQVRDRYAVGITELDFAEGTLHKPSNIRPNRLFSASTNLILYRAGRLNDPVVTSVIDRIIGILQAE